MVAGGGRQAQPRMLPWSSAAHGRSEYLRLRSVVDALVRVAEHPGDTRAFLGEATATAMELTRATGAVVLMTGDDGALRVASSRGQMRRVGRAAFDEGQTLARACLASSQVLHSEAAQSDGRIHGDARAAHALASLIATPLRFGDQVLGVLEVCSSVACAFDDIDTQAVALIGNALGGALGRQVALDDNARLLARLEAALESTRARAREYQDAAYYDALTGLPNRARFMERLDAACRRTDEPGRFAVMFLDLDGFKEINDTHGHAMGDAVLRETAAALRSRLRAGDVIARLGGDEFVVLLDSLRDGRKDLPVIAKDLAASLEEGRPINGVPTSIRASVGWVLHDGRADAAAMLAAADTAMYRNKRTRRRAAASSAAPVHALQGAPEGAGG